MNASQVAILVLFAVTANMAPVIIRLALGNRWNAPLDGGLRLFDRNPMLGQSKTIRGVVASVLATALLATLLGFSLVTGAVFALLAMLGDACSSFVKRRLGFASHKPVLLLDQLPESLLPLFVMQPSIGGTTIEILAATGIFTLVDLLLSPLYGLAKAH